jgi:hypothetical protein
MNEKDRQKAVSYVLLQVRPRDHCTGHVASVAPWSLYRACCKCGPVITVQGMLQVWPRDHCTGHVASVAPWSLYRVCCKCGPVITVQGMLQVWPRDHCTGYVASAAPWSLYRACCKRGPVITVQGMLQVWPRGHCTGHVASFCMRLSILTAVKMSMLAFWVVTPCGLVGRYQMKMETVCSSDILVSTYNSTRGHNPEESLTPILVKRGLVHLTLVIF